jgi:hypothetical protein
MESGQRRRSSKKALFKEKTRHRRPGGRESRIKPGSLQNDIAEHGGYPVRGVLSQTLPLRIRRAVRLDRFNIVRRDAPGRTVSRGKANAEGAYGDQHGNGIPTVMRLPVEMCWLCHLGDSRAWLFLPHQIDSQQGGKP